MLSGLKVPRQRLDLRRGMIQYQLTLGLTRAEQYVWSTVPPSMNAFLPKLNVPYSERILPGGLKV